MADTANQETSWWETGLNWLGNTATNLWNSKLQSDVAKAEADALAQEKLKNETDMNRQFYLDELKRWVSSYE